MVEARKEGGRSSVPLPMGEMGIALPFSLFRKKLSMLSKPKVLHRAFELFVLSVYKQEIPKEGCVNVAGI